MNLESQYRVVLNRNLVNPLFIQYLSDYYRNLVNLKVLQQGIKLDQVYKFNVYYIPNEWGTFANNLLLANAGLREMTPHLLQVSEILLSLDPLNPEPSPVLLEFSFTDILGFVFKNVGHYQQLTKNGLVDYFGVPGDMWFNDFPIRSGTVIRAVDYGTLENYPYHLFDSAFRDVRAHLLDLFARFNSEGVDNNADIQTV